MKTHALILSAILACADLGAVADASPSWIFLGDKGLSGNELQAALSSRLSEISPRARARRRHARGDLGVDALDLPVHPAYIESIAATGATIRVRSRWLNAVSVEADDAQLTAIAALPHVTSIRSVGQSLGRGLSSPLSAPLASGPGVSSNPGMTAVQLALSGVPSLHGCGLSGKGVVVGVLDTGFSLTHQVFAGLKVLARRDFVNKDDVVANQAGDPAQQDHHGTMVLASLAGKHADAFSAPAPGVSVILAKIDDLEVDKPIEDDWWVAGLEWAEQQGADLVTNSIGFCTKPCDPSQMDGETEATSIAAAAAVKRGLIVVSAAGNSGPSPTSLNAPADAEGVIAVGSVSTNGVIAGDSSRGPTWDKRVKPDIVAPGAGIWTVKPGTTDAYNKLSGTSFSAPYAAGVIALILQATPGLTPAQLLQKLKATASRADAPDNAYGWGVINMAAMAETLCSDLNARVLLDSGAGHAGGAGDGGVPATEAAFGDGDSDRARGDDSACAMTGPGRSPGGPSGLWLMLSVLIWPWIRKLHLIP